MSPSHGVPSSAPRRGILGCDIRCCAGWASSRSEEHTSELQSQSNLVCRLLLEKKNNLNAMGDKRERRPSPVEQHSGKNDHATRHRTNRGTLPKLGDRGQRCPVTVDLAVVGNGL